MMICNDVMYLYLFLYFLLPCTLIRFRELALDSFTLVHCMREINEMFTQFCFVCHRYLYYCFRSTLWSYFAYF